MTQFLKSFKWLLLGYALFGRPFAYIGVPPLFIGEVFLAWGIIRAPIGRAIGRLFALPTFTLLFCFMFYCGALTLVGATHFKLIDTLRDGAIWGYAIFAVIIAAYALITPNVLVQSLEAYRRFAFFYVFAAPVVALLGGYLSGRLPTMPGTQVPILITKYSDVQVHLAGIVAFVYLGFRRLISIHLVAIVLGVIAMGALNRGGFLAFFLAVSLLMILKPRFKFIMSTLGVMIVVMSIFTFLDFDLQLFGRSISTAQVGQNILSIVGLSSSSHSIDLQDTRQWRLNWWNEIIDYTFHGNYFWTGKGFGINLAEDDGIVDVLTEPGEPLRSPHNSHLTFLARGGVPLFFFWLILQLSWGMGMLRTIFRARARGDLFWEKVSIFLLTYWVAMIVNMNFDVYLEGPMGGIWFWTIWGYGLAVMWLYRYRPQSLAVFAPVGTVPPPPNLTPQPAE